MALPHTIPQQKEDAPFTENEGRQNRVPKWMVVTGVLILLFLLPEFIEAAELWVRLGYGDYCGFVTGFNNPEWTNEQIVAHCRGE